MMLACGAEAPVDLQSDAQHDGRGAQWKGKRRKRSRTQVKSHCNASHARQFVAALVSCPLPYLPARSEGALARVARRIDLPPARKETVEAGRATGDRGAGDADTTDTTAPAACDAPRGRGSAIGTVGADQSRGGGRRRSVIGDEGGIGMHAEEANAGAGATRARRGERGETGGVLLVLLLVLVLVLVLLASLVLL